MIEFFDNSAQRRLIRELLFFDQSSAREIDFNYAYARVTLRSLEKIENCSLRLGLKQASYDLIAETSDRTVYQSNFIEEQGFLWAMHFGTYELHLIAEQCRLANGKAKQKKHHWRIRQKIPEVF